MLTNYRLIGENGNIFGTHSWEHLEIDKNACQGFEQIVASTLAVDDSWGLCCSIFLDCRTPVWESYLNHQTY